MNKRNLNTAYFSEWLKITKICYIGETIQSKRLKFSVTLLGDYVVEFGDKLLYKGADYNKAKEKYEKA